MSLEADLLERSQSKCELCGASDTLGVLDVSLSGVPDAQSSALVCETCRAQVANEIDLNPHHWHCLNETMWSDIDAVKVLAWRVLNRLKAESWAQDLLHMLYLEEDQLNWAKAGLAEYEDGPGVIHKDSNGAVLSAGDTVTLIKDLPVKGAGFTAKRGTAVRNISLVPDNPQHIEGRVSGQQIVILTQFVKRST
ncbi:PhnA domain-containing protein [Sneathiella sp.]|jgi:protein PhnA|uniref:PhnA domain-containing protein n=1 Tax=Sneathiella sp. TaxID=1964365 RepID=UPI0039E3CF23